MKRGITSRADLVDAFCEGQLRLLTATAQLLGLEKLAEQRKEDERSSTDDASDQQGLSGQESRKSATGQWTGFEPVPVPHWRLVRHIQFTQEQRTTRESGRTPENAPPWRNRPVRIPAKRPLATKREVLTTLRKAFGSRSGNAGPDLTELTERISHGQLVDRIPRKFVRSWGTTLHVILDRSIRLIPYWSDQDFVCEVLKQIYPEYSLTISIKLDRDRQPMIIWLACRTEFRQPSAAASNVLVLGDLGCLIANVAERGLAERFWVDMGRATQETGHAAMALMPWRMHDFPGALAEFWNPIAWENARFHDAQDDPLKMLLTLSSHASRLEPGLLREIRRMIPGGYGRPELEAMVWQHETMASRHSQAATFDSEGIQPFRDRFPDCGETQLRTAINELIRDWHSNVHESVWFEELLAMDEESRLPFADDVEDGVRQFLRIAAMISAGEASFPDWAGVVAEARDFLKRIPASLWNDKQVGSAIHSIHEAVRHEGDVEASSGMHPRFFAAVGKKELTLHVQQSGDQFIITPVSVGTSPVPGSWIGAIRTRNREFKVSFDEPDLLLERVDVEKTDPFWLSGNPPAWAHEWDQDKHGLWCSFRVGTVQQMLRWVPAGSFQMGSPENEEGRESDEGPQHEVTISAGFWMFETPCTQELWDVVMEENRSKFKGPRRPVENVSWNDSQECIKRLNAKLPGLELRLPTEAQWEFSCRAGSTTPRYGNLDKIAWHSGNSQGTTHDVKQKVPNTLGLHDMLGNVWEWCLDPAYRRYTATRQTDPLFEDQNPGSNRVLRGGSWYSNARFVRSACRNWLVPGNRIFDLGFRLLSSSEQAQPRGAAVSGSESLRSGASKTATSERPRSEKFFSAVRKPRQFTWKDDTRELRVGIPTTPWMQIESDIEVVSFQRDIKPSWADRSGRDAMGLWAEFSYRNARQRLRWIPPGRFLMGSPTKPEQSWIAETPQHAVSILRGFWMFDSPCTQELFEAVLGKDQNESQFRGLQQPVENVYWDKCQQFISRLNEEISGLNLSLPAESQWEYCCRAGTEAERYGEIDQIAWYDKNSNSQTHDVKQLKPNAWGLFDMLGNVWEWCADGPRDYDAPLPAEHFAKGTDGLRVVRGGGWDDSAGSVRAAARYAYRPVVRGDPLGFRCLSSSEPSRAMAAERK